MGADLRKRNNKRMSQQKINQLLSKKPQKIEQKAPESIVEETKELFENLEIPPIPLVDEIFPAVPEKAIETEPLVEEPPKPKVRPLLHNDREYDTLDPETRFKEFISYIRKCIAQYEYDQEQLAISEEKIQDLMHFMEMTDDRKRQDGFRLYKELTKARRERRACKNEMELLAPVYELFHKTKLLDQMAQVQGNCRIVKKSIKERVYSTRTDILDQFVD